jgi:hypothetical protein
MEEPEIRRPTNLDLDRKCGRVLPLPLVAKEGGTVSPTDAIGARNAARDLAGHNSKDRCKG